MPIREVTMKSTGRTARFGMSTFVGVIFVIGMAIAAIYVWGYAPGKVTG